MKLRYTPEALRDLQEIKRYIKSEIHKPTAANRITKAILDGCAQLKQFPEMGVSIGAKTGYETDLRMLVVESYIDLYRIETETVSVGRIINARPDYIRILKRYPWKGNVRELRNVVERSLIISDGDTLAADTLPLAMQTPQANTEGNYSGFDLSGVEKMHIQKVLKYTNGNKTETSRLLGIGLTTLYRKIEEYGL